MYENTYVEIPEFVIDDIIRLSLDDPNNQVKFTKRLLNKLSIKTQIWCNQNYSFKFAVWSYRNTNKKFEIRHCANCGKELTENQLLNKCKYCCSHCKNTDPEFQKRAHQRLIEVTGGNFGFKNKETSKKSVKTRLDKYWPELDNNPTYIETTYAIPEDIIDLMKSCRGDDGRVKRETVNAKITDSQKQWFVVNNTNIPILSFFIFKKNTNIVQPQYCKVCGNPLKVDTIILGGETCSKECAHQVAQETWREIRESDPEATKEMYRQRNIKSVQTSLERYGVTCAGQSKEAKEKRKATNLERYGSECVLANEDVKAKARQTSRERYGTDYYVQTEEAKERYKQTCLRKYGVEYYTSTKESQEQRIKTSLEKYGTEFPSQSEQVKEKIRNTNMERYGVPIYLQSDEGKARCEATKTERYGKDHLINDPVMRIRAIKRALLKYSPRFDHIDPEKVNFGFGLWRINNIDEIKAQLKEKDIIINSTDEEFFSNKEVHYKCLVCGEEWTQPITYVNFVRCPKCSIKFRSLQESDFCNMIKNNNPNLNIITNTRSVLPSTCELDVWIPEKNIAFEFNGVFWHNDSHLDEDYHFYKKHEALNHGINVVHIFSNFWETKKDVLEKFIQNLLGLYELVDNVRIEWCEKNVSDDFMKQYALTLIDDYEKQVAVYNENKLVATALVSDDYVNIITLPNIRLSDSAIVNILDFMKEKYIALDANYYSPKWYNDKLKQAYITSAPFYYTKSHDVITQRQFDQLDKNEKEKWAKLYNCGRYIFRKNID